MRPTQGSLLKSSIPSRLIQLCSFSSRSASQLVDRVVPRDQLAVAGTQLLERAARVEEELKATRGLMDERFDDSIAQSNKQLVKVPIDLFSTGGNPISRSADKPVPAAGAGQLLDRAPSLVYHLLAIDSVAAILEAGMALVQIATRIDSRLKQAVEEVCTQRGLKIGRFVQDALLDKLEELEDIEDLKAIRFEPTKSWTDVLSDLELDGEV